CRSRGRRRSESSAASFRGVLVEPRQIVVVFVEAAILGGPGGPVCGRGRGALREQLRGDLGDLRVCRTAASQHPVDESAGPVGCTGRTGAARGRWRLPPAVLGRRRSRGVIVPPVARGLTVRGRVTVRAAVRAVGVVRVLAARGIVACCRRPVVAPGGLALLVLERDEAPVAVDEE